MNRFSVISPISLQPIAAAADPLKAIATGWLYQPFAFALVLYAGVIFLLAAAVPWTKATWQPPA